MDNKKVLDVCCASKGMWFDKNDDRCLYLDIRKSIYIDSNNRKINVNPDIVGDFTDIKQPDNSFWHVVFDPPHIKRNSMSGNVTKYYGRLEDGWEDMIKKGFEECFRVLKPNGTLVFKWSSIQFPIKDVLKLTKHKPLYGHKSGKRANTHWVCFIKDNQTI